MKAIDLPHNADERKITVIKLKNGEELVAMAWYNKPTNEIVLRKPCLVQLVRMRDGQTALGIAYWAFTIKEAWDGDGVSISADDVLCMGAANDELYNQYNSEFGSKLVIPEKNLEVAPLGLKLSE